MSVLLGPFPTVIAAGCGITIGFVIGWILHRTHVLRARRAAMQALLEAHLRATERIMQDSLRAEALEGPLPTYCPVHQHFKWCEHNGGVHGPAGWVAPERRKDDDE